MRTFIAAAAALALGVGAAAAQGFPSRPITLVVPYPAGGPTDTLARVMAEPMREALGQPVVIENVPGAGGMTGSGRVARAAPDGHQLIFGHFATHVILPATQTLNYDVVRDFTPIALIADTPQGIGSRASLPAKDMKELIAWLKERPGKATMGSIGVGGPSDLSAYLFQQLTGTSVQLVPYRGAAPMLTDLIGGQIDLGLFQVAAFVEQLRAGQIKGYAVLGGKRMAAAPNIPTTDEVGLPGFHATIWHGIWAPKDTPQDVVAKLNAAVVKALTDNTVKKRFADLGQDIWPRQQQTPEALAAHQKAEIAKWWPIVKAANIKPK